MHFVGIDTGAIGKRPEKRRARAGSLSLFLVGFHERFGNPRVQEFALENLRREAKVVAKERIVTI